MPRTTPIVLTVALALAGGATTAGAASQHLGGQPQLQGAAGERTATLHFAADRAPSKITFAGGQRAGRVTRVGSHGSDRTYDVRVTSPRAFRDEAKYTVTFRFGGGRAETRRVTFRAG